jgi:hypothetical protein
LTRAAEGHEAFEVGGEGAFGTDEVADMREDLGGEEGALLLFCRWVGGREGGREDGVGRWTCENRRRERE